MNCPVANNPFLAHGEGVSGGDEGADGVEAFVERHGADERFAGALGMVEDGGERHFCTSLGVFG